MIASIRSVTGGTLAAAAALAAFAAMPAPANGITCKGMTAGDADGFMATDCSPMPQRLGARGAAERAVDGLRRELEVGGSRLEVIDVSRTPGGRHVRFQQLDGGVPVWGGQVVVSMDGSNAIEMIQGATTDRAPEDVTPRLSAADALELADDRVDADGRYRVAPTAELVSFPYGGAAVLAWHVVLPTATPVSDWNLIVDADSGAVLAQWDAIARVDGSGLVFSPNPVQETGNTALVDANDANSVALDGARASVALTNLNASPNKLIGSFADLTGTGVSGCTLPYTPGAADEPTRVYNYQRSDDRFEEANVYHAITEAQKLIQSLGFSDVNNRSVPVDAHCITADNAFFSPVDTGLHFGDGGVDDAEDADIVLHEYGHSIHEDQVPGFGPGNNTEQGAIGEGFGDLFATMFYLGTGDAAYEASVRKYCVAEWDAVSYNPVTANPGSGCLRWTNGRSEITGADIGVYDGNPTQVHSDGRYWSAAMTCVFEGMGGTITARNNLLRLVIDSHERLVPDNSKSAFENQIASMLVADENLLGGANSALIQSCAAARGLVVAPGAPTITGTDPPSPADDNNPEVVGSVPATGNPTQVRIYKSTDCSGIAAATGTVAAFEGAGITVNVPDNSTTNLSARATGPGGDSACSNTIAYTEVTAPNPPPPDPPPPLTTPADTTPPETSIDKRPKKRTTKRRARFAFSAGEAGATFTCSLNGKPFKPCTSPVTVRAKRGKNRFAVRATDTAGNTDATPATYSWKVKRRAG